MSEVPAELPSGSPAPPVEPHTTKQIHSLVVDTGPLIKNDPLPTVLREKAEKLYTIPSVLSEIRDATTRSRVETTLLPFLELRSPRPDSVAFVTGFARRTGDLAAISRTDLELIALAYEIECERNGGDWRLRKVPGQKRLNGRPPGAPEEEAGEEKKQDAQTDKKAQPAEKATENGSKNDSNDATSKDTSSLAEDVSQLSVQDEAPQQAEEDEWQTVSTSSKKKSRKPASRASAPPVKLSEPKPEPEVVAAPEEEVDQPEVVEDDEDTDDEGWITPSNLQEQQAADAAAGAITDKKTASRPVTLQAALLTSDYAMQNVSLRMNLNLLSPSFMRITRLKTWILRCHGCFTTTKDMTKQFCPSCGQPTLLRTACSTDERGQVRLHLKRNFQWNNRGNVYSVPKPTHGSSNGRLPPKGANVGGQGGWGRDLMLAEDQKEFLKKGEEIKRERKKDLMDEDRLPGLLTGDRPGGSGKIKVGAGRSINSKRRR